MLAICIKRNNIVHPKASRCPKARIQCAIVALIYCMVYDNRTRSLGKLGGIVLRMVVYYNWLTINACCSYDIMNRACLIERGNNEGYSRSVHLRCSPCCISSRKAFPTTLLRR